MTPQQKVDAATFAFMAIGSALYFRFSWTLPTDSGRRARFRAIGALSFASVLVIGNVPPLDSLGTGVELALWAAAILGGLYCFSKAPPKRS
jgi:hypothetical protein